MGSSATVGISVVLFLVSFVCSIIILIDAFKNEWWKGLLCLLCGIYMLYYAFTEFQNERKPLILALWLGALVLGYGSFFMGMPHGVASPVPTSP